MPRILLVNGNTNQVLTEHMTIVARAYALADTEVVGTTAGFGASFVVSRADEVVAAHAVLDAVDRYDGPFDAVLVAISLDCAVPALRERLEVPVLGMTEAACRVAKMVGTQVGFVTAGSASLGQYQERIEAYGMRYRLGAFRSVDISAQDAYAHPAQTVDLINAVVDDLVRETDCDVVVPLGAAFTGLHRALQERLNVSVLDGLTCGVSLLESMLRLNVSNTHH